MLTAEEYRQAEFGYTLAESRRGFRLHATVFAVVISGLIALNALLIAFTDADFPWVVFPIIGWSIGLMFHYRAAFHRAGSDIRERQRAIERFAKQTREFA